MLHTFYLKKSYDASFLLFLAQRLLFIIDFDRNSRRHTSVLLVNNKAVSNSKKSKAFERKLPLAIINSQRIEIITMKQFLCIILFIAPIINSYYDPDIYSCSCFFYDNQYRNFYFTVNRYLYPTDPGAYCGNVPSFNGCVGFCLDQFSSAYPFDQDAGTSTNVSAPCIDCCTCCCGEFGNGRFPGTGACPPLSTTVETNDGDCKLIVDELIHIFLLCLFVEMNASSKTSLQRLRYF